MAEEIEPPAGESTETGVTRRSGRGVTTPKARRGLSFRRAPKAPAAASTPKAAKPSGPRTKAKPLRSLVILSVVGGLVVAIALPALSTRPQTAEAMMTLQQVAADDAQSLVVASDATASTLTRESYAATTQEEIDKKKAEEAAATRAKALSSQRGRVASIDLSMTAPGSGEVRWPLTSFSYESFNLFRPPNRPGHNGLDMMAPAGEPIFAAAAGVVRTATDSGGSFGVVVMIDSVVGGQVVSTTYAHMTYGSRVVSPGQTVSAGQLLGQVGRTGNATATHCHFEVRINGGLVDPLAWLQTNAG